ncbi:hypothetical protein EYF80_043373 [Liparis tanakae]|uniref:Uncharacterized protein n=1 Tax=Liparis tanakae TaxID=230148 RepID=A0A4Z2FYS4_9TELE|nr:hypothetical protein EYF80_043373 [Liparis tanakae]
MEGFERRELFTGPFTEIFSTRPLLLSCSFPAGGSLVRTYRSFRLSESTSEPFRFCSVTLDEDPGGTEGTPLRPLNPLRPLTCRELQAPVDGHSGPFAPPDVHGELQAARVRVHAVREREAHLVRPPADGLRRVDQQPVQDVLVGEGGALIQDPAVLQRLRVKLTSAEFA